MLALKGVEVAAGGTPLLSGVDLELRSGEMIAVTGPSGCGKTSLLRVIAGLADPVAGEIILNAESPASFGYPAYRRRVTLLQQQPALLDATVEVNLKLPFNYHSATGKVFPADLATTLLERLDLPKRVLAHKARQLSVGQQQRVALVRALLLQPQVLLMDEPTGALDAESVALVEAVVREQSARTGLAALLVTHDRTQAQRWCHYIVDLKRFRVRMDKDD